MSEDFYDETGPAPAASPFGPIFTATYESEDACCGDGIEVGDQIRADGQGGWIHDGHEEHAVAVQESLDRASRDVNESLVCSRCFCIHKGKC